jgi:hypothetical protein
VRPFFGKLPEWICDHKGFPDMTDEEIYNIRSLIFSQDESNVALGWAILEGYYSKGIEEDLDLNDLLSSAMVTGADKWAVVQDPVFHDIMGSAYTRFAFSSLIMEVICPMPGVIAWPWPDWFRNGALPAYTLRGTFWGKKIIWRVLFDDNGTGSVKFDCIEEDRSSQFPF